MYRSRETIACLTYKNNKNITVTKNWHELLNINNSEGKTVIFSKSTSMSPYGHQSNKTNQSD